MEAVQVDLPDDFVPGTTAAIQALGQSFKATVDGFGVRVYVALGDSRNCYIAQPGEWIIKYPDDRFEVMDDARFRERFEPVVSDLIAQSVKVLRSLGMDTEADTLTTKAVEAAGQPV